MHDYVKNLAKVVRAAREEAHLSQAALAEQIGCDERTILNIENDRSNPKFEVLCQIIAYLHIPADLKFFDLLGFFRQKADCFNGIPFVPQKLRNFPAILEHRKIQANPL